MPINNPAIRQGLIFGVVFGAISVVYNVVTNLLGIDDNMSAVINVLLVTALLVLFCLASARSASVTGDPMTGVTTALIASTISSCIGVATLWIITLAFMDTVRHNPFILGAFQAQGYSNVEMYDRLIIQNVNGLSFFAPMLSLTLAVGVGTVGGLIGKMRGVHQLHA